MKITKHLVIISAFIFAVSSCSTEKFSFRTKLKVSEEELAALKQQRETQSTRTAPEFQTSSSTQPLQNGVEPQNQFNTSSSIQLESVIVNHDIPSNKVENETTQPLTEDKKTVENDVQLKNDIPEKKSDIKDGEAQTDGMAIASFVLSIAGLFIAGLILGTLGIIFGAIGIGRTSGGKKKGQGLAIAGLVIGILDVLLILLLLASL